MEPADVFLRAFVDNKSDAKELHAQLFSTTVNIPALRNITRLPPALQEAWARGLRNIMAAMIKHGSSRKAAEVGDDLLPQRLAFVSKSAQSLQQWFMSQVSRLRAWAAWFEPGKLEVTEVMTYCPMQCFSVIAMAGVGSCCVQG